MRLEGRPGCILFGRENGEPSCGVLLGHEFAVVLHEHLNRGAEIERGLWRIAGGGQPIGCAGMAEAILGVLRLGRPPDGPHHDGEIDGR